MCMYYVCEEVKKVIEYGGTKETVTYDPSEALMVCDDLVAAEKYFKFFLNKKKLRVALIGESYFNPAHESYTFARKLFGVSSNEYGSGFEIITSTIDNGNGGISESQHVSTYVIEDFNGNIHSCKLDNIVFYKVMGNLAPTIVEGKDVHSGKIIGQLATHVDSRGNKTRRIKRIINRRRVNLAPFEVIFHR